MTLLRRSPAEGSSSRSRQSPSPRQPSLRHPSWRQRGAVIVETALVAPLLIALLVGIGEFGLAWHADNTVATVLRSTVIDHARHSSDRFSDLDLIQRVRDDVDDPGSISWVMIYRSSAGSTKPPSACATAANALSSGTGGVTGRCVIFSGDFIATATRDDFDDPVCDDDPDMTFCPITRAADFATTDRLGVAIRYRYRWLTGMIPGGGITIQDQAVSPQLGDTGDSK